MTTLFSVDLYVDDRYAVVAARGSVSAANAGPMRLALDQVVAGRPWVCIFDAAGLEVIDETAEDLLLDAQEELADHGGRLVLVNVPAATADALSPLASKTLAPIHLLHGAPIQPWRSGQRVPGDRLLGMFGLESPREAALRMPADAADLDAPGGVFARIRHAGR